MIEKSNEELRKCDLTFLEASFEPIAIHVNDTIIEVNDSLCVMTKYPRENLIGMNASQLFPKKDQFILSKKLEEGMQQSYGTVVLDSEGQELAVEFRGKDFFFYGQSARFFTLRDISSIENEIKAQKIKIAENQRKQDETLETLMQNEMRFRDYTNMSADWFWEMDEDLRFTEFSEGIFKTTGVEKNFFVGKTRQQLIADSDLNLPHIKRHLDDLTSHKIIDNFMYCYKTPNGDKRYACVTAKPLFDDQKKFLGYRGTTTDITERKKVEETLQENEERFRRYFELGLIGMAVTSLDKGWVEVNEQLCNFFGYSRYELFNLTWAEITHPDDLKEDVANFNRVLNGEIDGYAMDKRFIRKDGEVIYASISAKCVRKDNGTIDYFVALIQDISNRKKAEALLNRRNKELIAEKEISESANRAKSKFLAAASHDLRQPLQAIRLFSSALENSLCANDGMKVENSLIAVRSIEQSVDALGSLLNSLLDISKLDSGVVSINISKFPIQPLLDGVLQIFHGAAVKKGLQIKAISCFEMVNSDPVLVKHIVDNLVSNAVRYTETGKILIGCRRSRDDIRIEIWDTGMGIKEGDLDEVFEEFHQLDNPARQRKKGLGLGLAIVKRTANILGHKLNVRSTLGKGSVFSITIPRFCFQKSNKVEKIRSLHIKPTGTKRTVLAVDDDPMVLNATVILLESWGYIVKSAPTSEAALEMEVTPDFMIVDYQLPGNMTGLDVYLTIIQKLGRTIPGIIISGDTSPTRLEEAAQNDLILMAKPINPNDLQNHIKNSLNNYKTSV